MAYTNTYQRINWQNLPSEATALNDVNLNKMDAEIYNHGEEFETVDTAITNINSSLNGKVDKEAGKGLSAVKSITISPSVNTGTKIAEISYKNQDNLIIGYEIKNGVVVDSALSSSSENPVQNKVVKSAIDAKSTVSVTPVVTEGTVLANITIDGTTTAIKGSDIEVDDTPSATSENPLQNKAIYEMLNNLLPEGSESGNPISISDASGLNAKACSVDLLPIQDLHGYDSPWIGGAGKNKLQVTTQSYSTSGVTIAVNNGVLTLSNTSTDNIQINLVTTRINVSDIGSSYKLVDDGSFTFSSNLYLNIRYYDSNGSAISNQALNSGKSMNLVIPNNATTFMPMVVIKSGVATNGTIKPMLMLQTETNLSFAPYENICPISGRNSVEVKRTGKNLANPANISVFNSNKYFSTLNYSTTPMIPVKTSTQYVLSCRKGTPSVNQDFRIYYWDSNNTVISNEKANPFTTPNNCEKISFYCGYTDGDFTDGENVKAQVEEGSTATAYEPYQGETYTETLGQTVYGGNVDFVSGTATITHTIVDLGDYTWTRNTAGTYGYWWKSGFTGVDLTKDLIAEQYKGYKTDLDVAQGNKIGITVLSNNNLYVCTDDSVNEPDGLLCYPLATPITLTLTAEQISLLKGNNVISSDGDNINLVYSADIDLYIAGQLQNS